MGWQGRANVAALNHALETVRAALGDRAVNLSEGQRRHLVVMGAGSRAFCGQAGADLQACAGSLPAGFEVDPMLPRA